MQPEDVSISDWMPCAMMSVESWMATDMWNTSRVMLTAKVFDKLRLCCDTKVFDKLRLCCNTVPSFTVS